MGDSAKNRLTPGPLLRRNAHLHAVRMSGPQLHSLDPMGRAPLDDRVQVPALRQVVRDYAQFQQFALLHPRTNPRKAAGNPTTKQQGCLTADIACNCSVLMRRMYWLRFAPAAQRPRATRRVAPTHIRRASHPIESEQVRGRALPSPVDSPRSRHVHSAQEDFQCKTTNLSTSPDGAMRTSVSWASRAPMLCSHPYRMTRRPWAVSHSVGCPSSSARRAGAKTTTASLCSETGRTRSSSPSAAQLPT